MKKIGLINIDTSHPLAFSQLMQDETQLDMQYSMVYNDGFRDDNQVNWFVNKYNMEGRAESIEELAEKCDIGFIQSCNWDKHIEQAMPFIEKGKPVFLDKPMVGSESDVKKIRDLIKNGATIVGCSSARYCTEVQEFLALPIEERGEVVAVYAESGMDEFNYSVHVGEIISEIAGAKAVSCKFVDRVNRDDAECELFTVKFENGVIGTYCTYLSGWRNFNVSIITTKTSVCFKIDSSKLYIELLKRISEFLKTGKKATADVDTILNVTEFMLCGKKSRDSENGREVKISELSDCDSFDGAKFEEGYGASAAVLYKD